MDKLTSKFHDNFSQSAESGKKYTYHAFWHGTKIGSFDAILNENNTDFDWKGYTDPYCKALFSHDPHTGLPWFIRNALPDNAVFRHLKQNSQLSYLDNGTRHLSNLTILREDKIQGHNMVVDILDGRLTDFTSDDGTFEGTYKNFQIDDLNDDELPEQFSQFWKNPETPRFSGEELKLPATLQGDGTLTPGTSEQFTHFIKFPAGRMRESWGFNEWMCMELSEAISLPTAPHAMLDLGDDKPPAYIVERYDIPGGDNIESGCRFMTQDFCTLARHSSSHSDRYKGTIERIGDNLRSKSSNPEEDAVDLYKRTILSWALGDDDFHRKNVSMLFYLRDGEKSFSSARLAPTYDVTSEIWIKKQNHNTALLTAGRRANFAEKHWLQLAQEFGIQPDEARNILTDTLETLAEKSVQISNNIPAIAAKHSSCVFAAQRITTLIHQNTKSLDMDISVPEWSDIESPSHPRKIRRGKIRLDYSAYIEHSSGSPQQSPSG